MTPTRGRLSTGAAALLAGTIAAALLAGCAADDAEPTAAPSTPAATTGPTPSPTETAAPTTPVPGAADRPLDALDAYALCRAQTGGYYDDPGRTEFAPFEEATVLLRDDGDWYVYMEVDDFAREPALVEAAGSECIVGGTFAEPEWQLFGTISREYADESIADYNRPPAQD